MRGMMSGASGRCGRRNAVLGVSFRRRLRSVLLALWAPVPELTGDGHPTSMLGTLGKTPGRGIRLLRVIPEAMIVGAPPIFDINRPQPVNLAETAHSMGNGIPIGNSL
jgi:hypothetical protein